MKCLTCPACVLTALLGGVGLLRLASRATQAHHYGPGFHHAWPLTLMGVGLFLAGASFGVRVGLDDRTLVLHRAARLLLIGGVSLGTTLALLGLLAALTPLL
jgi:hypothetical protein